MFENMVREADAHLSFPYAFASRGFVPVGQAEWREYVLEHVASYRTSADIQVYTPLHAFLFQMTRDPKCLTAARHWLLGVCAWPEWGLLRAFERDYETGWILQGVSLAYDWICEELNPTERAVVRSAMTRRASNMCERLGGQLPDKQFSTHGFSQVSSLGLAGLALLGEEPQALQWIEVATRLSEDWLNRRFTKQGAALDALAYYGWVGADTSRFLIALEALTGADEWKHPQWKRGVDYTLALYSGRIDTRYCDYNVAWDHHLHSLLFLAARRFRDGEAQWLPLHEANHTVIPYDDCRCWEFAPNWDILNYLWYDESIAPLTPTRIGHSKHFEGVGIVMMRSGWSKDDVWLVTKCGATDSHSLHAQPENRFDIKGFGETLSDVIITDYASVTDNFNTVLVNGKGQSWLYDPDNHSTNAEDYVARNSHVKMEHHLDCGRYASVLGNAAAVYPKLLTRYDRHIQMFADKYFVVHDTLCCPTPSEITWPLHCEGSIQRDGPWHFLQTGDAELCVRMFCPDDTRIEVARTVELFQKNKAYEWHDDGRDPWRRADGRRAWPLEQRERYADQPYLKVTIPNVTETRITALLWPRRISAAQQRPLPDVQQLDESCFRIQRTNGSELLWYAAQTRASDLSSDAERGSLSFDRAGSVIGGSYFGGTEVRLAGRLLVYTGTRANLAFAIEFENDRLFISVENHQDVCLILACTRIPSGVRFTNRPEATVDSFFARGRLHVIVPAGLTRLEATLEEAIGA